MSEFLPLDRPDPWERIKDFRIEATDPRYESLCAAHARGELSWEQVYDYARVIDRATTPPLVRLGRHVPLLSRLRSLWRSTRPIYKVPSAYRPHAGVNLLPQEYRDGGTPPERGSWVLSASTGTREASPRTPATVTTAVSSSFLTLGDPWAGAFVQTSPHHGSSFTERGWSTGATEDRGASGAPLGSAD